MEEAIEKTREDEHSCQYLHLMTLLYPGFDALSSRYFELPGLHYFCFSFLRSLFAHPFSLVLH